MTEIRQAELLASWLASPKGTEPPSDLPNDVLEAIYALRPDLAPKPRVTIDEILASRAPAALVPLRPRRSWAMISGLGIGLAAAATLLVVLLPTPQHSQSTSTEAPAGTFATDGAASAPNLADDAKGLAPEMEEASQLASPKARPPTESAAPTSRSTSVAKVSAPYPTKGQAQLEEMRSMNTASPADDALNLDNAVASAEAEVPSLADERNQAGMTGGEVDTETMNTAQYAPVTQSGVGNAAAATPAASQAPKAVETRRDRTEKSKDEDLDLGPGAARGSVEESIPEVEAIRTDAERLTREIAKPVATGMLTAERAVRAWLALGDVQAALQAARTGLELSKQPSPERKSLLLAFADALDAAGQTAGAAAARSEAR